MDEDREREGPEAREEPPRDWEERGRAEGFHAAAEDYGAPPHPGEGGPTGKAVASMVLGILSLVSLAVCCGGGGVLGLTLAVAAWVLGHREISDIREGLSNPGGEGMAKAGLIMGIIGTAVNGLVMVGFILYVILSVFLVAAGAVPPPP